MGKWVDLAGQKRADSAMLGDSGFVRVPGDRYWTEPWVTEALLSRVQFRNPVWEPACGRGDMLKVLLDAGYVTAASDVEPLCEQGVPFDFVNDVRFPLPATLSVFASIVTNPPYEHAEAFLRRALTLTKPRLGMVAMLFRNEYDCAAGRRDLFEQPPFRQKLVLTRRPRWLDANAQHSASPRHNFSWFVWDWQHTGPATIGYLP